MYVASGYVVMAVGFIVFGFILQHQVNRIDDTQKRIKQTQADLGALAIHNSGAICLVATVPTHMEATKIVDAYLAGNVKITALFTPKCAEVARRAARDVFDDHPPSGLNLRP